MGAGNAVKVMREYTSKSQGHVLRSSQLWRLYVPFICYYVVLSLAYPIESVAFKAISPSMTGTPILRTDMEGEWEL